MEHDGLREFEETYSTNSKLAMMGGASLRRQSAPEQLYSKKKWLEEELKRVTDAIEFLEKNPDFTNGLHLISLALR